MLFCILHEFGPERELSSVRRVPDIFIGKYNIVILFKFLVNHSKSLFPQFLLFFHVFLTTRFINPAYKEMSISAVSNMGIYKIQKRIAITLFI
jgi:hypothetical protein